MCNLPTHAEAHPVVFLGPSREAKSEGDNVDFCGKYCESVQPVPGFCLKKNWDGYYLRNGYLSFCQNFCAVFVGFCDVCLKTKGSNQFDRKIEATSEVDLSNILPFPSASFILSGEWTGKSSKRASHFDIFDVTQMVQLMWLS